jgi:hypothetical protein
MDEQRVREIVREELAAAKKAAAVSIGLRDDMTDEEFEIWLTNYRNQISPFHRRRFESTQS